MSLGQETDVETRTAQQDCYAGEIEHANHSRPTLFIK